MVTSNGTTVFTRRSTRPVTPDARAIAKQRAEENRRASSTKIVVLKCICVLLHLKQYFKFEFFITADSVIKKFF